MVESAPLLFCPDTQKPYHAKHALEFVSYIKKHYKIPDENMYHCGDEIDAMHGGAWPKGADYPHTPNQELQEAIDELKRWYSAFPKMKLAISNHGLRWARKASGAEIPSRLMREYREVIEAPPGWIWQEEWIIPTKHPIRLIHGQGYGGINGHRNAAIDAGMNTVIGHLHSAAAISYITTSRMKIWAMNAGSLIDPDAYAFEYGKYNRLKPGLGVGVVLNKGSTPIWIPYSY
jgi:hypothetical protein